MRNKFACTDDLLNYFKKSDLLKGLTLTEQAQLRKNIGIVDYTGEGGQSSPISLSYTQFNDLQRAGQLITGACYVINDFQTIYSSNTMNSLGQYVTWGSTINPSQVYKLYVRAISNRELDKEIQIEGKEWKVEYDSTQRVLSDGITTKGSITYLEDENGNSAYYDFKNIKWNWSKEKLNEAGIRTTKNLALYTFSEIINEQVSDSSELHNTKHNIIKRDCFNNIFIGDTYYNTIEQECSNNIFAKGCHDSVIKWNSVNNRFNEPVTYLTGSIYNKNIDTGDTVLSTAISKTVHKVNDATIISFLDPITYAYQVVIL